MKVMYNKVYVEIYDPLGHIKVVYLFWLVMP